MKLQTLTSVAFASVMVLSLTAPAFAETSEQPAVIQFGASAENILSDLDGMCTEISFRELDPPPAPGITSRSQIDCDGFEYFGAPRLAEFVFLNTELSMVWILVEPDDIEALETAMSALHGEADIQTEAIDVHTAANAAVRRDAPEALFYAEAIEPLIRMQVGG